jgi:hypothetical protein
MPRRSLARSRSSTGRRWPGSCASDGHGDILCHASPLQCTGTASARVVEGPPPGQCGSGMERTVSGCAREVLGLPGRIARRPSLRPAGLQPHTRSAAPCRNSPTEATPPRCSPWPSPRWNTSGESRVASPLGRDGPGCSAPMDDDIDFAGLSISAATYTRPGRKLAADSVARGGSVGGQPASASHMWLLSPHSAQDKERGDDHPSNGEA